MTTRGEVQLVSISPLNSEQYQEEVQPQVYFSTLRYQSRRDFA